MIRAVDSIIAARFAEGAYKDFFEHSGVPTTTKDYATYRNATLQFIVGRGRRMAEWVTKHHPEIKVCNPWWQPTRPT